MQSLANLLAQQEDLERKYEKFLASLDQKRTVTLRELISSPEALVRLRAPWLRHDVIVERFSALGSFFEKLGDHPRFRNKQWLIFFQASPEAEDLKRHQEFLAKENFSASFYRDEFGSLPPQAQYLHTWPKWLSLTGSWQAKNRRIAPLGHFANFSYMDVIDFEPQTLEEADQYRRSVLGYRVPDWPKHLGVSDVVGTDYLIRQVIHDLGHQRLPVLNPDIDSLHNAVMLSSIGPVQNTHEGLWETIVHRECTDPYFYVDGGRLIREGLLLALTPLQEYYLRRLLRWYAGKSHREKMTWLWDIDPAWDASWAKKRMRVVIEEMCGDGFMRYNLKT